MIQIKEVRFNNIGIFTSPQVINFENKKRLIQVLAERSDYNGSSGSGKSTIFNAIDYALGINKIPASSLQSRKTKEGIEVGLSLVWDGESVEISRSKNGGLTVSGTDPSTKQSFIISGNVKQAEEKIDEIIGIPREIFHKMIHKTQKEGGFFLNLTPSEMYKFLVKALKLEEWLIKETKAGELAAELITEREKVLSLISVKKPALDSAVSVLNDSTRQLNDLKAPVVEFTSSDTLGVELSEVIAHKNKAVEEKKKTKPIAPNAVIVDDSFLQDKRANTLEEIRRLQVPSAEEADANSQLMFKSGTELELKSIPITKQEKIQQVLSIKRQIDTAKCSECPTCNQKWLTDSLAQYIAGLEVKVKSVAEEIKAITAKEEELKGKEKTYAHLEIVVSELKSKRLNKVQELYSAS